MRLWTQDLLGVCVTNQIMGISIDSCGTHEYQRMFEYLAMFVLFCILFFLKRQMIIRLLFPVLIEICVFSLVVNFASKKIGDNYILGVCQWTL